MLTVVLAVVLGVLIGAVLGGLGGGGSVLTVPALVYALGLEAQAATTSSLLIVGVTALAGVGSYVAARQVRWRAGLSLGVLGIPATYAGSRLNGLVDPQVLLLSFATLMLVVAALMLRTDAEDDAPGPGHASDPGDDRAAPDHELETELAAAGTRSGTAGGRPARRSSSSASADKDAPRWWAVALTALGVGLLTGFFGVGGGFAIVPALVLVLRLPMTVAVGTSLLVIALNSAVALASRAGTGVLDLDWSIVLPFTAAAVVATVVGKRLADRVPADRLQGGFALLLVAVALYQGVQSIAALA